MTDHSERPDRRELGDDPEKADALTPVTSSKAGTPMSTDDAEDDVGGTPTLEERVRLKMVQSEEEIEAPKRPAQAVEGTMPSSTATAKVGTRRESELVRSSIRPTPAVSARESAISSYRILVKQVPESPAEGLQPEADRQRIPGKLRSLSDQRISISRTVDRIGQKARPTTQALNKSQGQQTLLEDIEDFDPLFGWEGGLPYGTNRPTLVFHCADEDDRIPSFPFLQRCLRDTYAELEGGEPTVEQVEFVANEPQIPSIGGRIVTLDLTGGEWSPSLDKGRPMIERSGIDIVRELAEQADTLYSGALGYFVINVPSEWEDTYRRNEFFDQLVEHLADSTPPDKGENEGPFEKLRSAPITMARPLVTDPEMFASRLAQYYGFEYVPNYETIAQVDASFTSVLRSERWAKVALTKRQSYGEESSRHYNWKGLVTEGIARALWESTGERKRAFDTFVQRQLISDGPLDVEHPLVDGSPDDNGPIADVHLDDSLPWIPGELDGFLDDNLYDIPLAIEFETGFSEGAFGYRKLVESIEKYREHNFKGMILVVVPPRLLYRGERQARHLNRLVRVEGNQMDKATANLCVPTVSESRCTGLKHAATLITKLYDNA